LEGGEPTEEVGEWFREEDLFDVIQNWFKKYYVPVAMKSEHNAIQYILELYETVFETHCAFAKLLNKQQDLNPNRLSLIAYQLVLWEKWNEKVRPIEHAVFSFATIPFLYHATRDKRHPFPIKLYLPDQEMPYPDEVGRLENGRFYQREAATRILRHGLSVLAKKVVLFTGMDP
jgi:hypothetical protein